MKPKTKKPKTKRRRPERRTYTCNHNAVIGTPMPFIEVCNEGAHLYLYISGPRGKVALMYAPAAERMALQILERRDWTAER